MPSNVVRFDAIRSIGEASITASYQPLGPLLGHMMRLLHFINGTNGDMMISFDGVTDNAAVLAGTFALYDLTSNEDHNESFRYEKNTQLYIKYITAPSTGTFYVTAVYGKGE